MGSCLPQDGDRSPHSAAWCPVRRLHPRPRLHSRPRLLHPCPASTPPRLLHPCPASTPAPPPSQPLRHPRPLLFSVVRTGPSSGGCFVLGSVCSHILTSVLNLGILLDVWRRCRANAEFLCTFPAVDRAVTPGPLCPVVPWLGSVTTELCHHTSPRGLLLVLNWRQPLPWTPCSSWSSVWEVQQPFIEPAEAAVVLGPGLEGRSPGTPAQGRAPPSSRAGAAPRL